MNNIVGHYAAHNCNEPKLTNYSCIEGIYLFSTEEIEKIQKELGNLRKEYEKLRKVVEVAKALLKECPNIGMECDDQHIVLEESLKELEGE